MSVKISRILHAGYIFECENTQIIFDPIFENPFSTNCYAFPMVTFDCDKIKDLSASAIFISHFHDDHCSLESLVLLDKKIPIYIYCLHSEVFSLIKDLGFERVYSLTVDTAITIGSFNITPRKAFDSETDTIFEINARDLNILNVVDSAMDAATLRQLAKKAPWDMVLWPFQMMRETDILTPSRADSSSYEFPKEWIEELKLLNPRHIVPSSCQFQQESWSWYNQALFPISYKQFEFEIKAKLLTTMVVRINPSISYILTKHSLQQAPSLDWITPIENQDVDYKFAPDLNPPSTSEISKYFKPLSPEQTKFIYNYCSSSTGLLNTYLSLDPSAEIYFKSPRLWQLHIFDHRGVVKIFNYLVTASHIEFVVDCTEPIAWLTEIPIAKLYSALKYGEALTSLYMRINDRRMEPQIEEEIKWVDTLDDPLIRCLYSGPVGSYQMAQLKRLNLSNN